MLRFFFEIIVAVLAVYGGYTALHDLAALISLWIGSRCDDGKDADVEEPNDEGKEDSPNGGTEGSDHTGRDG